MKAKKRKLKKLPIIPNPIPIIPISIKINPVSSTL